MKMSLVDVDVIGRCGGMDGYGEMYGCWMMDIDVDERYRCG